MRILHLSDTHLPVAAGLDEDGVDSRAVLAQFLRDCRHLTDIDVVVVSGDISDDGSAEAYRDALALVGTYARTKNAATAYCVGNHDDRSAFQAVLGMGHHDRTGAATGRPLTQGSCAAVSYVDGLRLITLDSLVPGQVHGNLTEDQHRALTALLQQPAARGSVLIVHHPPVALDSDFWRSVNLRNPETLIAAIRGSDVRAVLCGHNHLQLNATIAGIPTWVTPGVVSRIDLTAPAELERAVTGAGATMVDLDAPYGPLFSLLHARDPRPGRELYLVNALTGADAAET